MLVPTNDGFFAVKGIEGPDGNHTLTVFSPAYDSGSERDDERCTSIPGPAVECPGGAGLGGVPAGGEEGYVHIHAGIHGIDDLDPARGTGATRWPRSPFAARGSGTGLT